MVTGDQILAHAIGDFLLQSHWMATEKTRRWLPCVAHVATYILPFLLLQPSLVAVAVMTGSHYLIDRYRLARWVCWLKNGARELTPTGYPKDTPVWLSTWLLIAADNTIHVAINGAALRWL